MAKWTALKLEDSQSCLLLRKIWGNDIVMTLIGFIFDKQKNNCDKDFILLATFITMTRLAWLFPYMQVYKICYPGSVIAKWGLRYNEGITSVAIHFQLQHIVFNLNWQCLKLKLRFDCISDKIFTRLRHKIQKDFLFWVHMLVSHLQFSQFSVVVIIRWKKKAILVICNVVMCS